MPRYKLIIEYDGGPYAGWQRQSNAFTVQQALEDALFSLTGEARVIHAAGRTDAGVHARAQVGHVDLDKPWRTDTIRDGMNAWLKSQTVCIVEAQEVPADFEARFSAMKRHYLYIIDNRRAPPALERGRVWHVARALDADAMHEAAQALLGKHDFTTFRASECQANSPVRTLDVLDVTRNGDRIEIRASALSFLHHQVRSFTGSLEHVGSGKWTRDDLVAALQAKDRARCGVVAPPDGLYLMRVDY